MKTDIPFIVTKRELEWLYKHQTKQILRQKKIITREKEYLVMIKWSIPQDNNYEHICTWQQSLQKSIFVYKTTVIKIERSGTVQMDRIERSGGNPNIYSQFIMYQRGF